MEQGTITAVKMNVLAKLDISYGEYVNCSTKKLRVYKISLLTSYVEVDH